MALTTSRRTLLTGAAATFGHLRPALARAADILRWTSVDIPTWDPHTPLNIFGHIAGGHVNEPLTRMGFGPKLDLAWCPAGGRVAMRATVAPDRFGSARKMARPRTGRAKSG
jgi:hypothetical protein